MHSIRPLNIYFLRPLQEFQLCSSLIIVFQVEQLQVNYVALDLDRFCTT
jgi:hypothetical protein